MDYFDDYSVDMDSECLNQDFDDVDLFGEKLEDTSDDDFGSNLKLD
jgi:hypothetical protein